MRRAAEKWTDERVRSLGPVTDLTTAGSLLMLGRTKSFEMARRGEFPVPVLKLGQRFVVPTAPLRALLGIGEVAPREASL